VRITKAVIESGLAGRRVCCDPDVVHAKARGIGTILGMIRVTARSHHIAIVTVEWETGEIGNISTEFLYQPDVVELISRIEIDSKRTADDRSHLRG
jgi:hypothetical protein